MPQTGGRHEAGVADDLAGRQGRSGAGARAPGRVRAGMAVGGTALAIIQGLIMVCSHPLLIDKSEKLETDNNILIESAYKLERIYHILSDIKEKNEKVIIFTKFRKMHR